jgi:predicted DNA-binding ribbon-helix-helix protein
MKKIVISLRIDSDFYKLLKQISKKSGVPVSEMIRRAVEEKVKGKDE